MSNSENEAEGITLCRGAYRDLGGNYCVLGYMAKIAGISLPFRNTDTLSAIRKYSKDEGFPKLLEKTYNLTQDILDSLQLLNDEGEEEKSIISLNEKLAELHIPFRVSRIVNSGLYL